MTAEPSTAVRPMPAYCLTTAGPQRPCHQEAPTGLELTTSMAELIVDALPALLAVVGLCVVAVVLAWQRGRGPRNRG